MFMRRRPSIPGPLPLKPLPLHTHPDYPACVCVGSDLFLLFILATLLGLYREGFCSIFLRDRVLAMAFRYKAARSLSYVARICNRSPQAIYTSQKWLCSAPAGSSLDEPGMKDCSFHA